MESEIPKQALLREEDEEKEAPQLCLICCDRQANISTLPCNHIVICDQCHRKLPSNSKCLQCVRNVNSVKRKCFYGKLSGNENMCKKCRQEPAAITAPCGHCVLCATCIGSHCATCQQPVSTIFSMDMQCFQL